jgi:Fe2+ transport system protein FeoA
MKCPLCGFEFDETARSCQTHCPMGEGCQMVCCPNCGYQGIDTSRSAVVNWMRRAWQRLRGEVQQTDHSPGVKMKSEAMPLSHFPKGQWARVAYLAPTHTSRLQRLSALGIAPGSRVRLRQRHPAHVVQVGHLELALDAEIAGEIFVTPESNGSAERRDEREHD